MNEVEECEITVVWETLWLSILFEFHLSRNDKYNNVSYAMIIIYEEFVSAKSYLLSCLICFHWNLNLKKDTQNQNKNTQTWIL